MAAGESALQRELGSSRLPVALHRRRDLSPLRRPEPNPLSAPLHKKLKKANTKAKKRKFRKKLRRLGC